MKQFLQITHQNNSTTTNSLVSTSKIIWIAEKKDGTALLLLENDDSPFNLTERYEDLVSALTVF